MDKCECVSCLECDGFGFVFIAFGGKYMGKHRCDDLDEMDTCPECGGKGVVETCDRCLQIIEDEYDQQMTGTNENN